MPGKPPLTHFISRPTMSSDCLLLSVQRPLKRVCEHCRNLSDFCGNSSGQLESFRRPLQEKCQGVPFDFSAPDWGFGYTCPVRPECPFARVLTQIICVAKCFAWVERKMRVMPQTLRLCVMP